MSRERGKIEVEILDVREVVTYRAPNMPFYTHIITYRAGDLPPRTVFIPASEDTPENRARIIREDIEKAQAFKPQRITV